MDSKVQNKTKRFYYVSLFILFGLLIAFCTSIVNYRLEIVSIQAKLAKQAEVVLDSKVTELDNYTKNLEHVVTALRDSRLLFEYIQNPNQKTYDNVKALFYAVANTNPSLMQVRYLSGSGMESIRVDWSFGRLRPTIIEPESLQDKSHRYYFKEGAKQPVDTFWYSHLDLNIENRKIEVPHKPVLRVSSPVYIEQEFQGIVIINVHAKEFLNQFKRNGTFTISLIDKDGYYLIDDRPGYSWSKYLETGQTIVTDYPQAGKKILKNVDESSVQKFGSLYGMSAASVLQKDEAILLLRAKDAAVKDLETERQKAALIIILVILCLSVPLALLISRGPANLHRKIAEQNLVLTEYFDLIDQNIPTAYLDVDGKIVEVSNAFSKILNMKNEEIVGSFYREICCKKDPEKAPDSMWEAVKKGSRWTGELRFENRDGDCYWMETAFVPKRNKQQKILGFSMICQDISDKKRIEELSITDVMTGLYNRRFFNTVIQRELNRALRNSRTLAFVMLDVDFFKQYNDHYGHQKGDEVLKVIAGIIQAKLARGSDYSFRLGGEEFGLLFTDVTIEKATVFAESVRESIARANIEHKWSDIAHVVTVSAGLLHVVPGFDVTVDKIYKLADEALYKAKKSGRNRVIAQTFTSQV